MRPILEFAGRNRFQNVPGKVVLNFEALLVEFRRVWSGVIWHCFSPERARSATEDAPASTAVGGGRWSSERTVDGLPEPWVLSQVTAMELIVGARDKPDLVTIDNFLSWYPVVPLRERIGARAHQLLKSYTKSHGLHIFDSLIAATAMKNALTLITLNRKHYDNDRAPPAEGAELLAARLLRIMLPCPRPRQTERIPDVPGTRGATM